MVISRDELEGELHKIIKATENTETGPILIQHIQDLAQHVQQEGIADYVHQSGNFDTEHPRFPEIVIDACPHDMITIEYIEHVRHRLVAHRVKPSLVDDFTYRMKTLTNDTQRRIEIHCWVSLSKTENQKQE